MTIEEEKVLINCKLFKGFSIDEIHAMLSCMNVAVKNYDRKEHIWNVGDSVRSFAVVLSGKVVAENISRNGARSVIATHTAGSLLGDVLMSTADSKCPVDVVAEEKCRVLFLQYDAIIGDSDLEQKYSIKLRKNLLDEISRKFWQLRKKITYLSADSLRQKIAMKLYDEMKATGKTSFVISENREVLANTLGSNRSALSRELSRMKDEGLIDYYKSSFKILKPNKIEEYL